MKRKIYLTILILMAAFCCHAQTKDLGDTPGATGTVTFTYQGKKVMLKTVRAKDGNIWLQQNLGSKAVASDATDEAAYGDLFQWGRWDDGHQTREPLYSSHKQAQPNNPTGLKGDRNPFLYDVINPWWVIGTDQDKWDAATPAQVTENDGCDPCKALGAGWRLPTLAEWRAVLVAEDITDGSSDMNSNLKLPFGGDRVWNNSLMENEGVGGYYWTATCAPNASNGGEAIVVYKIGVMPPQAVYRAEAMSIRCIKAKP